MNKSLTKCKKIIKLVAPACADAQQEHSLRPPSLMPSVICISDLRYFVIQHLR
jgi:hypothetical protein